MVTLQYKMYEPPDLSQSGGSCFIIYSFDVISFIEVIRVFFLGAEPPIAILSNMNTSSL